MKKQNSLIVALLLLVVLFISGFTIVDYEDYYEPFWIKEFHKDGYVEHPYKIKPMVLNSMDNLEKKGLAVENVRVFISPYTYAGINGAANSFDNTIVIANASYNTIYHELGHIYSYEHEGIVSKYERDMKKYYPDHTPRGTSWETSISEDFAEEFKIIFTKGEKRTAYPLFPNFYEWLLKNTQPMEITRKEAFDKLGGTEKLIKNGVVIGNTLGDYMLDKPIKRGELAAVLVRLGEGHNKKIAPFKDIKGKWFESYVNQIYATELIQGYPDGTFKGERFITRYELHMILDRIK